VDNKDKVEYWLDLADYDLDSARVMFSGGKYLYVGFMCHQVIEKSLKAVIARDCAEGEIPPKIHHLTRLAEKAGILGKMTEAQKSFLADLNPLNIEARYPEYKDRIASTLSKERCTQLISDTEVMLCWIKEQL
jgi:HEPN domain-containing protein